jgi:ubiquitin-activating enzyme E1 C
MLVGQKLRLQLLSLTNDSLVLKSQRECPHFSFCCIPLTLCTRHFGKIQDKDEDFYSGFNIIIAGLDSIEARRWINTLLVNMVDTDDDGNVDPDTIIPFIDGGTEGMC